jgi:methyl coenzyme M reductase subunit D
MSPFKVNGLSCCRFEEFTRIKKTVSNLMKYGDNSQGDNFVSSVERIDT